MQRALPMLAAAVVVIIVGGALAPRSPGHLRVAADTWLWPAAIGVSSESDVYVALRTATGGRMLRLSDAGE